MKEWILWMCWMHLAGPCPAHLDPPVEQATTKKEELANQELCQHPLLGFLQHKTAGFISGLLDLWGCSKLFRISSSPVCLSHLVSQFCTGPRCGLSNLFTRNIFQQCITMGTGTLWWFFFSTSVLVGAVLGTGITGITRIPKPCIAGIQASCGQRLCHVLRINPWFAWWFTFVMKPIVLWAEQVSRTCSWS